MQVAPEIAGMLAADAEPEQAGRKVRLAGNGGSAFDGRLDAAEAGGVPEDPHRAADRVGALAAAPDVKDTTAPKPDMKVRATACVG